MKKLVLSVFALLTLSLLPLIRAQTTEVIGKNLLDPNAFNVTENRISTSDVIKLESNETYTLSLPIRGQYTYSISVYSDYETFIDTNEYDIRPCHHNTQDDFLECTFTLDSESDGVYIEINSYDFAELFQFSSEGFQLEKGSTRTEYEPFEYRIINDTSSPVFQGEAYYITSYETTTDIETIIANHISVIDEVDGDVSDTITILSDTYSGNETTIGMYEVLLEAHDYSHNKTQFLLHIIVKDEIDPMIEGPKYIETNINDLASLNHLIEEHFTFSDEYDGVIADYTVNQDAYTNHLDQLGIYEVKISIEDSSGNHTSKTFEITVFDDEKPVIHGPNTITHKHSSNKTFDDYLALFSATDNVDQILNVTVKSKTLPTDLSTPGSYELILSAKDSSGNVALKTVTFIIEDDIAPVLTGDNYHIISYKERFKLQDAINQLSLSDNFDTLTHDAIEITFNQYETNIDQLGLYEIQLSVFDTSGNETTFTMHIEVVDDIAPVFDFSQSIILEVNMSLSDEDLFKMLLSSDAISAFNPTSYKVLNAIDYASKEDQLIELELSNDLGEKRIETIQVTIVEPLEESSNLHYIVISIVSLLTVVSAAIIIKKRI
ncbi:MAG: hypothetical protein ACLFRI_07045 [Candidatus Izemoplasmataceae bacterium]